MINKTCLLLPFRLHQNVLTVFPTGPAADGPQAAGRIGRARLAAAVAQAGRILPLHGPGGPGGPRAARSRPIGGP